MANHKSAIKRHRQSLVRRDRNRDTKRVIRDAVKEVRTNIAAGKVEEAKTLAIKAEKLLAKAANKSVLHKKTASRSVSRLRAAINKSAKK